MTSPYLDLNRRPLSEAQRAANIKRLRNLATLLRGQAVNIRNSDNTADGEKHAISLQKDAKAIDWAIGELS